MEEMQGLGHVGSVHAQEGSDGFSGGNGTSGSNGGILRLMSGCGGHGGDAGFGTGLVGGSGGKSGTIVLHAGDGGRGGDGDPAMSGGDGGFGGNLDIILGKRGSRGVNASIHGEDGTIGSLRIQMASELFDTEVRIQAPPSLQSEYSNRALLQFLTNSTTEDDALFSLVFHGQNESSGGFLSFFRREELVNRVRWDNGTSEWFNTNWQLEGESSQVLRLINPNNGISIMGKTTFGTNESLLSWKHSTMRDHEFIIRHGLDGRLKIEDEGSSLLVLDGPSISYPKGHLSLTDGVNSSMEFRVVDENDGVSLVIGCGVSLKSSLRFSVAVSKLVDDDASSTTIDFTGNSLTFKSNASLSSSWLELSPDGSIRMSSRTSTTIESQEGSVRFDHMFRVMEDVDDASSPFIEWKSTSSSSSEDAVITNEIGSMFLRFGPFNHGTYVPAGQTLTLLTYEEQLLIRSDNGSVRICSENGIIFDQNSPQALEKLQSSGVTIDFSHGDITTLQRNVTMDTKSLSSTNQNVSIVCNGEGKSYFLTEKISFESLAGPARDVHVITSNSTILSGDFSIAFEENRIKSTTSNINMDASGMSSWILFDVHDSVILLNDSSSIALLKGNYTTIDLSSPNPHITFDISSPSRFFCFDSLWFDSPFGRIQTNDTSELQIDLIGRSLMLGDGGGVNLNLSLVNYASGSSSYITLASSAGVRIDGTERRISSDDSSLVVEFNGCRIQSDDTLTVSSAGNMNVTSFSGNISIGISSATDQLQLYGPSGGSFGIDIQPSTKSLLITDVENPSIQGALRMFSDSSNGDFVLQLDHPSSGDRSVKFLSRVTGTTQSKVVMDGGDGLILGHNSNGATTIRDVDLNTLISFSNATISSKSGMLTIRGRNVTFDVQDVSSTEVIEMWWSKYDDHAHFIPAASLDLVLRAGITSSTSASVKAASVELEGGFQSNGPGSSESGGSVILRGGYGENGGSVSIYAGSATSVTGNDGKIEIEGSSGLFNLGNKVKEYGFKFPQCTGPIDLSGVTPGVFYVFQLCINTTTWSLQAASYVPSFY
eukprot:TRINITY_DN1825_c0_g2_i4.p1 TRINITY_DN1825_c0_g2~~TRINITY_DN1825_c0_g2_i4.p1  ORF type:complete len:1051 (+),score=242.45 TRINITY_DN1825_c0_g2_i4:1621-4773(+)